MSKRTTSIQLSEQAIENIELIKARFGLSTIAAAINLALQETARGVKHDLTSQPTDAIVESR